MKMRRPVGGYLRLASISSVMALVLVTAPPTNADPSGDNAANSYPSDDLIYATYDRADPGQFFIPGVYGVYFLSPTGLSCGIWLRGSFGCSGSIPGAPPGTSRIGWFNGDTVVHYDPAIGVGFPNVTAAQVLQPRSYVSWNETTCVTTTDSSTYCKRGSFRFLITDHGTSLSPWYFPPRW